MSVERVLRVVGVGVPKHLPDTVGWCGATYGHNWDLIVLDREPETDREREWLAHLRARLAVGGEMIVGRRVAP